LAWSSTSASSSPRRDARGLAELPDRGGRVGLTEDGRPGDEDIGARRYERRGVARVDAAVDLDRETAPGPPGFEAKAPDFFNRGREE
jgi:hypothetical protein